MGREAAEFGLQRREGKMAASCGVIFDVDGVLVDSYDAHFESWQRLGREAGFEMTPERFLHTFGRTSREIIAEFWPERASQKGTVEALDGRKEVLYREIVAANFPAMDGAPELIDALHADGFAIAAGTSGPPKNVELCLERLQRSDRFSAIVTARDVTRGKPDPEVFLLAAERLRLPPDRCVVIEDAPAGVAAAKAAGMKSIGLASRGRTPLDLNAADRIVHSLREITPADVRQLILSRPV